MSMACISLLTDFGLSDEYAGVMKAVVATINPQARVIDITHQIAPQDIVQAAFVLKAAYRYFPPGTVHLAVVDPGVGTGRQIVAARAGDYFFLGPDNGVLWPSIEATGEKDPQIVTVTNPAFFLANVGNTFHGRDIFAPVAAHLTLGVKLGQLGAPTEFSRIIRPAGCVPRRMEDGRLQGTVVGIDRFGNVITNIRRSDLAALAGGDKWDDLEVSVGHWRLKGLQETYAAVPAGDPLALIGSRDTLELAVNRGNAAETMGVGRGMPVIVSPGGSGKD